MLFNIQAKTRKTKDGYYQPVLIIDGKIRHTPDDWQYPSIDKKTAQKQAEWWKYESTQCGYVTMI